MTTRAIIVDPDGTRRFTPGATRILNSKRRKRDFKIVVTHGQFSQLCDFAYSDGVLDGIQHVTSEEECQGMMHFIGATATRFCRKKKPNVEEEPITKYVSRGDILFCFLAWL